MAEEQNNVYHVPDYSTVSHGFNESPFYCAWLDLMA